MKKLATQIKKDDLYLVREDFQKNLIWKHNALTDN